MKVLTINFLKKKIIKKYVESSANFYGLSDYRKNSSYNWELFRKFDFYLELQYLTKFIYF